MIFSPRVSCPDSTDFSSLSALLASRRFAGRSGQDLAIAIWEFMVDPDEGFYHFWSPMERLGPRRVTDPLKLLNVFGWGLCGTNANLMANLFLAAGLDDARTANLTDHVVAEVLCDGSWRLLDADMRAFHRKHPPQQAQIASAADCAVDASLITDQQNPSTPYYAPDRSLAKTATLYTDTTHYHRPFAEHIHTMDFVLRPGEKLLRATDNEGKWIWFDNWDELAAKYGAKWNQQGPRGGGSDGRSFANGQWVYQPQLSNSEDFEEGVFASEGLTAGPKGIVTETTGHCWCIFDFDSPYVYAGTPGGGADEEPRNGVLLDAILFTRGPQSSARIEMRVDPDLEWFTVWRSARPGAHKVKLDLTAHAANAYRYQLRFSFDAPEPAMCGLGELRVHSSVMLAPGSLGRLIEGDNELTVRFGDEHGRPTRRYVLETLMTEEDLRAKAHRLDNVRFDTDEGTAAADDPAKEYEIIFKLDAPPRGMLQGVHAFGSFRSRLPEDPDEGRLAAYVATTENGPWQPIFESPVLADPLGWRFSVSGARDLPAPAGAAYVKFTGAADIAEAKIRAVWLDERADANGSALEVTHVWEEASGCCKVHTERVASPGKDHAYTMVCGAEPKLRAVVVEAISAG